MFTKVWRQRTLDLHEIGYGLLGRYPPTSAVFGGHRILDKLARPKDIATEYELRTKDLVYKAFT